MNQIKLLFLSALIFSLSVVQGQQALLSSIQQLKSSPLKATQPDSLVFKSKNLNTSNNPEAIISYNQGILKKDFDFRLTPVAKGKFNLDMLNDTKAMVFIKVYDIIGNLIYQEQLRIRGGFIKEFDLSFSKTDFFVVQIGNEDYNKTKTIVAAL